MTISRRLARIPRTLRGIWRGILSVPRSLRLTERVIDACAFPQHDWAKRLRRTLASDDTEVTWQQAINPFFWMVWSTKFVARWLTTRPYLALAPSVPAVLAFVAMVAMVIVGARRDDAATQAVYLDLLRTSLSDGDTEAAAVAAQRLLAIDPKNLEHQYQSAMLDDELGKSESARRAIVQLALQKEYGPAALWMLKALVYEEPERDETGKVQSANVLTKRTTWTKEERELCHRCAGVAMTKLPSERAILAKKIYATFLSDNGLIDQALELYETIAEYDPSVNLVAAQLANQVAEEPNDYAVVQQYARAAIRTIGPKLGDNPTSVDTRLQLAQALVLDERDREAYDLLVTGMQISPHPLLKMAVGETRVFTAERLKRNVGASETLAERGPLLYEALEWAPTSPLVLEAVVQFSIECSQAGDRELQEVRKRLLTGVEPPAMHFIEGTVALMNGEHEKAQHHLSLAASEWKNMGGLLNNLAYTLLKSGDREKLSEALKLSNAALDQIPGYPALLETRGQILLKMERYQEAIADLEKALVDPNMRPSSHAGLAEAYEALGLEDLAKDNRELSLQSSTP